MVPAAGDGSVIACDEHLVDADKRYAPEGRAEMVGDGEAAVDQQAVCSAVAPVYAARRGALPPERRLSFAVGWAKRSVPTISFPSREMVGTLLALPTLRSVSSGRFSLVGQIS